MPRSKGPQQPAAEVSPDYQLATRLLSEFRQKWVDLFKEEGSDAVKFSRLSVVALTQLSAILAVDVGMQPEQFTAVCAAQFTEALKNAPRFG